MIVKPKVLLAAAVTLTLAGCAHQPKQTWYRAGATQQDFAMDRGQCQAQGLSIPEAAGYPLQVALVSNACMRGKGWELR
jgi:hypothetical protein